MWYIDMIDTKHHDITLDTYSFKTKKEAVEFKKAIEHYKEKGIEYYLYDEEEHKRIIE